MIENQAATIQRYTPEDGAKTKWLIYFTTRTGRIMPFGEYESRGDALKAADQGSQRYRMRFTVFEMVERESFETIPPL
jgi:hypothetical protein